MSAQKQLRKAAIPAPFLCGLLLAGGFMAFTAWDQSYWWRIREDYSFGWLVPLFVGYLIYDRWPKVTALARGAENRSGEPVDERGGLRGWRLSWRFYR